MKKEEIKKYIYQYASEESLKNNVIEFCVLSGNNQIILDEEFDYGYDVRLDSCEYIDNSVTIVAYSKENKEIFAKSSIFITDYNVYKNEFFWQRIDENTLEKKFLSDYKEIMGDITITLGYTQISNRLRFSKKSCFLRAKLVQMFYGLVDNMIHELSLFVHVEPCGVCYVDEQSLKKDTIEIDNNVAAKLGYVDPESVVSYKIAKKLGMNQMLGLYHDSTLGPVFFSIVNDNDVNEV